MNSKDSRNSKRLICIECPVGCALSVCIENGHVIEVAGNKCLKGEGYAISEVENPVRVLTSAVLAEGLDLKMVPVKTGKPIPKINLMEGMQALKKMRINAPVAIGDVVAHDFLGLGVDLIATRGARVRVKTLENK